MPKYTYPTQNDFEGKDRADSGSDDRLIVGAQLAHEFSSIAEALRTRVVASLKWNIPADGVSDIRYGQNIKSVHNMDPEFIDHQGQPYNLENGWGQCRVYFENLIPDFDIHYAVLVQPYATSEVNSHVIATVNWQDSTFVQWAWGYLINKGEQFVRPPNPPAFSMLVVDAYQGEAN
jgi:hypothetical protein